MINIVAFTTRMVKLAEYRKHLSQYLSDKVRRATTHITNPLSHNPSLRSQSPPSSPSRSPACPPSFLPQMSVVAPNLGTLIGDTVAARLISKAGSLTSLAKCPASTIQILGAEKAVRTHILSLLLARRGVQDEASWKSKGMQ